MLSRKNRLYTFGSFTLVGLAATLIGVITKSPEAGFVTATVGTAATNSLANLMQEKGLELSLETLKYLATITSNIFASDTQETLENIAERLREGNQEENHDITRAIRQAIVAVIQANLAEIANADERTALQKIINTDESGWAWVELLEAQSLANISEDKVYLFFSQKVEDIAKIASPVSKENWKHLLLELARRNSVFLANETYEKISLSLTEKFPQSLREVFAEDFNNQGRAYSKLLINLLGDVRASLSERFEKLEFIQQEVLHSQQKNFPEIIENQQRAAELLEKYIDQNESRQSKTVKSVSNKVSTYGGKSVNLPTGWALVTPSYLNKEKNLSEEYLQKRAIRYFDGISPIWSDALSPLIPKREIVGELIDKLKTAITSGEMNVILLSGSGGEGKTTAFLQTICGLVETENNLNVVWQKSVRLGLPRQLQRTIAKSSENWLIVVDEAYAIAKDLYECFEDFHRQGKDNVHFFLSSRTIDWKNAKAIPRDLERLINFEIVKMPNLNPNDAKRIVEKWFELGAPGMKKLSGRSIQEATEELLKTASRETFDDEKSSENSLLGSLILLREGKSLVAHITSILENLSKIKVFERSDLNLLDVFSYIAVLDAEGYPLITKNILSKVFQCSLGKVKEKILSRLMDETVAFKYENVILTRHRVIADKAVQILEKEFGKDFENILIELIKAAEYIYVNEPENAFNPSKWNELPKHYFEKGGQYENLGIKLAKAFVRLHPTDCFYLNNLASLLRRSGKPKESLEIYENSDERVRNQRSFYSEWGTSHGIALNHAINAWLSGIAIAEGNFNDLDNIDAKICLNGIATAFLELFERYKLETFKSAFGAATQLGIKLPQSEKTTKTHRSLVRYDQKRIELRIPALDNQTDIESVKNGIIEAWKKRETELPAWVKAGDSLTFEGLKSLF